jgi:cysteine synthase A
MGDNVSLERRQLIAAYGAELVIAPTTHGIKDSFDLAEKLIAENGYIEIKQFENPHNPETHVLTTGPEIAEAFGDDLPDAFVAGVGTGGTITGTGGYLKKIKPDIEIIAVEPDASPVLSGGNPSPHKLQGIGAGFVPSVLNTKIYEKVIRITNEEAFSIAKELAEKEGLLLGISSAAAIFAAIKTAERLGKGKKVLAIAPDTGERYLSTSLFGGDR